MASSNQLPNLVVIPKGYAPLNSDGMQLANLAAWHLQRIGNTGLLSAPPEPASTQAIGSVPNPAATQRRVWLEEPPGSIPFDEQNSAPLPAAVVPPADTTIMEWMVPHGFDGVIKWISNVLLSDVVGFLPGMLVWKIMSNGRPIRNFGNITVEKGTLAQGREVSPIRIFSGDIISYTVSQISPAALTGTTVVSLTGYFYPSKGIS